MPKQTEPPEPIRISANTIWDGKHYIAGEPLPFERLEDLPPNLRPYIAKPEEEEPEGPGEPRGSYELNTLYRVTDDNKMGRKLRREVAQLNAQIAEEEWIEEQFNAPLREDIAQDLSEQHAARVALSAAQMESEARMADLTEEAAREFASPTVRVRRGSVWALAERAKLRPGEQVFIKLDGEWKPVGTVNENGELPHPKDIYDAAIIQT